MSNIKANIEVTFLLIFNWIADQAFHDFLSNIFLLASIGYLLFKWYVSFVKFLNDRKNKLSPKEIEDDTENKEEDI